MIVTVFGQWAGNGIISYYLSGFLDSAGVTDPIEQLNINLGNSCQQFFFAVFGGLIVEKAGRRPMLIICNAALSVVWIAVTISTSIDNKTGSGSAAKASIAFVFIFGAVYSTGWTPLQALYPVEVLSYEMRAKGMVFHPSSAAGLGKCANSLVLSY